MSVAHAAPGEQRKSQQAEREFRARAGEDLELDAFELLSILNTTFAKGQHQALRGVSTCASALASALASASSIDSVMF